MTTNATVTVPAKPATVPPVVRHVTSLQSVPPVTPTTHGGMATAAPRLPNTSTPTMESALVGGHVEVEHVKSIIARLAIPLLYVPHAMPLPTTPRMVFAAVNNKPPSRSGKVGL
jgi:hypothetical protein